MRISLGPLLYFWNRQTVLDYYNKIAQLPVDIVYLGETVCAKRRELRVDDWLDLAAMLADAGKEVVLSTLSLIEAESDLALVKRVCQNGSYRVEANDMAAINLQNPGTSFVVGPHINTYNSSTLAQMSALGARRWVMPLELAGENLKAMQAERPVNMETEVFVFGRLPLAFSARCYTARAHNISKDDCGFCCREYEQGLLLSTREQQPFLVINGIQMQSARTFCLVDQLPGLAQLGVDIIRLSPQLQGMTEIIDLVDKVRNQRLDPVLAVASLKNHMPTGSCDGYWYGDAGMDLLGMGLLGVDAQEKGL
ncbi:MAG: U32 family peptidase [Acidiferrobacterales bacterium]